MSHNQKSLQGKFVVGTVSQDSKMLLAGRVGGMDSLSNVEQDSFTEQGYIYIVSPFWRWYKDTPPTRAASVMGSTLMNATDITEVLSIDEFISKYFEVLL